ncbi:MAG TPA: hypothetical protein VGY58_18760 [Gemmataceae bacterium]|jgi:hypothetical protein|nr:hypothetical protein [Gemmataceae bacterium]
MLYMVCRNRVADYAKWREVFEEHAEAHRAAGLVLRHVWRTVEDPNNIYFVFEVGDIAKACAFISTPEAAAAGRDSGVVDGEYHFAESAPGY